MMNTLAKRKEPSGTGVDAENHVPAANLAQATVKRRFVPPKMASPAGQISPQPLSIKQRNMQQPWRKAASNPQPGGAAGPAAASHAPAHYYSVLYTKKSNKVPIDVGAPTQLQYMPARHARTLACSFFDTALQKRQNKTFSDGNFGVVWCTVSPCALSWLREAH
jgi:hypothetical protein